MKRWGGGGVKESLNHSWRLEETQSVFHFHVHQVPHFCSFLTSCDGATPPVGSARHSGSDPALVFLLKLPLRGNGFASQSAECEVGVVDRGRGGWGGDDSPLPKESWKGFSSPH